MMDEQEWEGRIWGVKEKLKRNGIEGCFPDMHQVQVYSSGKKPDVKGPVCRGCWKRVSNIFLLKKHYYCRECMKCRNNESDYEDIFREIESWMYNFVPLQGKYDVHMRWNRSRYAGNPVKIKKRIGRKPYISCRTNVLRHAIPRHMVLAYLDLWMEEENSQAGKNRELCRDFLKKENISPRGNTALISMWYMLQYMYANGEGELADNFRELIKEKKIGSELEELIHRYPFFYQNDLYDDRQSLGKMLSNHPIKSIVE